jgi:hypothetical protein
MLDLGFKEFELAMRIILAIEIVRIIKKKSAFEDYKLNLQTSYIISFLINKLV